MDILKRFLEYIQIDTESDENNCDMQPSSKQQWVLAKLLKNQLEEMGAQNVYLSEYGVVYAMFPATLGNEQQTPLGFIAHMDTVLNGRNIKARVIEEYDGKPVVLSKAEGVGEVEKHAKATEVGEKRILCESQNPTLSLLKGRTLIVTDGTTILGADDKAGVAAIMHMCQLLTKSDRPHGKVCIAFTPDEEIGCGVDHFELDRFGAKLAVTVDGGAENVIECENFNAAHVTLLAEGVNTHPGSAKGCMKNAISVLSHIHNLLPQEMTPEHTEGREGFFHLLEMKGNVESAQAEYLIREFDRGKFENMKLQMKKIVDCVNQECGDIVKIMIKDSYYNMAEIIDKHKDFTAQIEKAIVSNDMKPEYLPIRGGTDGCRLSFEGLPCPNIGAGGYMFHSVYEHCTKEGMEKAANICLSLIYQYAKQ